MKYLSNISRIHNIVEIDLEQNAQICFYDPFLFCGQKMKVKSPRGENLITKKYARKRLWDQRNRRKNSKSTKYARKNCLYLRNTHEKTFRIHEILTKAQWQDNTKPMRSMLARNLRNFSTIICFVIFYFFRSPSLYEIILT